MSKQYRRSLRVPPFFVSANGIVQFFKADIKLRKMYIEYDIKSIKYDKNA